MTYIQFWWIITVGILIMSCGIPDDKQAIKVFHYNQHNEITSLDPAFAKSQNNIWAVNHIFSTLVQLDDSLNIIPGLASRWTVSEDALEYTLNLRNDVLFHPDSCFLSETARRVDAEDVVYSFSRLLDPVLNAPGSWIFKGKVDESQPFEAIDDTTVVIRLKKPFAPLMSLLTMAYCSIVPPEAVAQYGNEFFRHPVGSGPFMFGRWINSEGLFLKRYQAFHEWRDSSARSNLDAVRTSFIGERSIALLELFNGRIDLFSGLESSYVHTVLNPDGTLREGYENIQFIKAPFLNFEYMGINPSAPDAHPLLAEPDFRKALNYGIDRAIMLATLRNRVGFPADAGCIPRGLPSYDPAKVRGFTDDQDEARRLLSSFDSKSREVELVISTSKDYLDLTTFIARQWQDLGLNTRMEVMESATLRDAMRRGNVALFRASWIADYPDGESFLSMFYSGNPAPPNYTRFSNPEFDQLYETALRESNKKAKTALYQSMDRILIEHAPVVFLFYDEVALFASANIHGISRNALNLLQVKNLNVE